MGSIQNYAETAMLLSEGVNFLVIKEEFLGDKRRIFLKVLIYSFSKCSLTF